MGPEPRTGLTSAHLVQLAFPALRDLPLLAPPPERSFTELIVAPEVALTKLPATNGAVAAKTDPGNFVTATSGAHEITRNEWCRGRQDRSGAGAVAQPSAMLL